MANVESLSNSEESCETSPGLPPQKHFFAFENLPPGTFTLDSSPLLAKPHIQPPRCAPSEHCLPIHRVPSLWLKGTTVKKVIVSLLFLLTLPYVFGQGSAESSVRGNLAGAVVDSSGALVQGAKVTISGATGTKSDTTNQDGQFLFPLLTPGFYNLKVEKGSFKTADAKGIEVVTGRTSNLRVSLIAGQQTETVEVSASAISVDTSSTAVAANLTDTFYQSVPVARGVTGLFYASPGVTSGGGTGTANPSISGGTGLENLYVADGVNITDGGFGGIGVYSALYGSLSTGINLSFVKEVQVKTGGFEAQYGKSTGGIVQIVTKSGGDAYHGSIGGFFAPSAFEATRKFTDDFQHGSQNERFNLQGKLQHQSNFDVDAEVGGYVPHFKDKLFFFGSFNPQWNSDQDQLAQFRNPSDLGTGGLTGPTQTALGNVDVPVHVYSYAAKLTYKLSDKHQLESSFFGDPTYGDNSPNATLTTANKTTFDKLQYGTRNFVVRYNGSLSPSWLVNGSFSWGHNNLSDTPAAPNVYQIADLTQRTPCGAPFFNADCTSTDNPLRGSFGRQGLGFFQNTQGDNYGLNLDTSKSFRFLGEHNVSVGYSFARSHYDGTKFRTGPNIPIDAATADSFFDPTDPINGAQNKVLGDQLKANGTNAAFQLRSNSALCGTAELFIPGLENCPDGGEGVFLRQTRGEFGNLNFKTQGVYHTLFAQDSWALNKFVTINAGLRWEQQRVEGGNAAFTFTDNWSPRIGISIDPWGNRKTKIYANFGRYTESLPLDIAIRSLSNELDFADVNWLPPTDPSGHVLVNPDGTIDLSHLNSATDIFHVNAGAAAVTGEAFAPGTRSEYLDEYVVGFEHEFGNSGVIFTARYTDRRVKRILEDMAALSPEAAQLGITQQFVIGNPTKNLDVFVNPQQIDFTSVPTDYDPVTGAFTGTGPSGIPAGCPAPNTAGFPYGQPTDSNGNVSPNLAGANALCIANPSVAGNIGADGIPDGFVDPVRIYKSMEFEVNKSFSKNWQLRANYRIAKLFGNYEGSFRNDTGQNDPNISSLFDFTRGDFNLLGAQFEPGVLNTDVRHLANGFVSYTFGNHYMKGLTLGTTVHFQTGIPINNLFAHPVYANAGEIPFCADNTTNCASARGSLGRTQNYGGVDLHADYPIRLTERTKIRLAADLFNLSDQRTLLNLDQNAQRTVGVPNADFGKPLGIGPSSTTGNSNPGYQRPFYARFGVKFEF
jgi:hypothetical protein